MLFGEKVFKSFKAHTNEKVYTAHLNQIFNQELYKLGIIFTEHNLIKVLDLGSGPGDTLIQYLMHAQCPKGFEITLIDTNFLYTGSVLDNRCGQIYSTLLSAKMREEVRINDFHIINGKVFDISLRHLLEMNKTNFKYPIFNLLYLSHGMYSIISDEKGEWGRKIENTILEIASDVLDTSGIAVIYNMSSLPQTFLYFRTQYSKYRVGYIAGRISIDPSSTVTASCIKHSVPYYDLDFSTKLYFSQHIHENHCLLKDHVNHEKYLLKPSFVQDYNNLCFIISAKSLNVIAASGWLDVYVDEILLSIKLDKYGNWYLQIAEKMQVIISTKSSTELRQKVQHALQNTAHFL